MDVEAMIVAGVDVFKKKVLEFCAQDAGRELSPGTAEAVAHGLQQALAAAGTAAYRAFLESKDGVRDVVEHDGEAFRFKYAAENTFMTLWGQMALARRVYQNASDTKTFVPLDAAWGMAGHYMSVEVREAVAFACAHVTPDEAAKMLEKCALFHPHATQIKRAVEAVCAQTSPCSAGIDARIRDEEGPAPEQTRALAASLDGANLLLREAGGAKRGRPAQRPDADSGQSETTAYKNAMVGSVTLYGPVPKDHKTPQRLISRYVSHMPEERAVTFKAKFEAELDAVESKLPPGTVKILLCDGARNLWKYIEDSGRYKDYEQLIDYWHALEHLSLAAEALFGKGNPEANKWYKTYKGKLLEEEDGAQRVLRSMDYHAKTEGLSKARLEALRIQKTFYRRNQARMTYADFRKRGLPIGSGPVEAACKTLVKTRLCRSGMRWTRQGGQRILDLRTYVKSDRWDKFWGKYKQLLLAA